MQLVLDLDPGWKRIPRPAFPGVLVALEADFFLDIPPLVPLPEDVWGWSGQAAARDVPRAGDAKVEVTDRFRMTGDHGWTMAIAESRLIVDGAVAEGRIHATVVVLELGTIVAVHARDPQRLAARRDEVLRILASARPDWQASEPLSLREMLSA